MANSGGKRTPDVLESAPRRRQAPAPTGRATPRRPSTAVRVGAGVAVAAALGGTFVALSTGDEPRPAAGTTAGTPTASAAPEVVAPVPTTSTAPAPAQVWRDAALVDLRPLTGLAVNLGQGINAWRAGTTTAAATAAALDRFTISLGDAQTAIDARAPFAGAPGALLDLRLTARLYLAAVRTARVATDEPAGPLQDQLVLQFLRLRNLGDRFFDQTAAELERFLGARRDVEGVTIVRTGEVPDWVPMKLAAGPPLAEAAPTPTSTPRTYVSARPTQPLSDWLTTVRAAAVPSGAQERAALESGTRTQLADLAVALTHASDALFGAADPEGERLAATRVQLSLLVHAEAARAAEAATLLDPAGRKAMTLVARTVAGAGDLTWDDRLGARTTGYPAT